MINKEEYSLIKKMTLSNLCNKIRAKTGKSEKIPIENLEEEIDGIKTEPILQTKTFTENGTFTPDEGYQGFSSIVIETPVAPEYKHIEGVGF